MILPAKDKNGADWNQAVLFAVSGCSRIAGPLTDGTWETDKDVDLDAYYAWTPPIDGLRDALTSAAQNVATVVTKQVAPDDVHLTAFQNGFSAVVASGGQPPTIEPLATAFAQNAAVYGKTAADFAPLVLALGAVSLQLSTALRTLQVSAAGAQTSDALGAALTDFENTIAGLVAAITEAGVSVTLPENIVIPGITTA